MAAFKKVLKCGATTYLGVMMQLFILLIIILELLCQLVRTRLLLESMKCLFRFNLDWSDLTFDI